MTAVYRSVFETYNSLFPNYPATLFWLSRF